VIFRRPCGLDADHGGLLDRILSADPPPFALIHRPASFRRGVLEVLVGEVGEYQNLADLPVPPARDAEPGARHDLLALVPYRQIAERGYECVDDGAPLIGMRITGQAAIAADEVRARIPDLPVELSGAGFDIDDETYAATVRAVLDDEIGHGVGANFVIKRSFTARIGGYGPHRGLALFNRLLAQESGAYWTFIVYTGATTLIGASPERHVGLDSGTVSMNPISGTYRYPPDGPTLSGVLDFLRDPKEIDELYMVVDEELKMMSLVCDGGGRVTGPRLKEMANLAHTEYFIEGASARTPQEILRGTLFAPTVTGSPLESACRVIRKYEPEGRGYYAGAVALFGRDEAGAAALDSAILIRTAEIDRTGALRLSVGATLVRHSRPWDEVAETMAKAAGLLAALRPVPPAGTLATSAGPLPRTAAQPGFARHQRVAQALAERNRNISAFWTAPHAQRRDPLPGLEGLRVLLVDAEDTFTGMLGDQLAALGLRIEVRRFDEAYSLDDSDAVVLGPGPGDPRELTRPKIRHLHEAAQQLLRTRRPFLAVCLSHQVLCRRLGLEVGPLPVPNQGLQREIEFFGASERVGFYNSFAAHCAVDSFPAARAGRVRVSRNPSTGEVYGLLGRRFASTQFHVESVLTLDGPRIVGELLRRILTPALQNSSSGRV